VGSNAFEDGIDGSDKVGRGNVCQLTSLGLAGAIGTEEGYAIFDDKELARVILSAWLAMAHRRAVALSAGGLLVSVDELCVRLALLTAMMATMMTAMMMFLTMVGVVAMTAPGIEGLCVLLLKRDDLIIGRDDGDKDGGKDCRCEHSLVCVRV